MIRSPIRSPIRSAVSGVFERRASGGAAAFDPMTLFASGEQGVWYDPSDMSSLWQDAGRSIPVTAAGQSVAVMDDKSGNANHLTLSNAVLGEALGLRYITCNGSTTGGVTSAINFSGTSNLSIFAGIRKLTDAAMGMIAELSATVSSNNGTFWFLAGDAGGNYSINAKGTAQNYRKYSTYTAPITNVISASLTSIAANSAAAISVRVDGVLNAGTSSSTNVSSGNFGTFPLYLARRNLASLPFSGNIYGFILRGAVSTAEEIANTEAFIGEKAGVFF